MLSRLWLSLGLASEAEAEAESESSVDTTNAVSDVRSTLGPKAVESAHFSVAFTTVLAGTDDAQRIPFDRVLSSNPASVFDTGTNQFTCPLPGSYFFTYNIHPEEGKAAAVCLMKNDTSQVMLYAHKNKRAPGMASQSAILDLETDDTVWLQLQSGEEYGVQSHPGTPLVTFTGIMVKTL